MVTLTVRTRLRSPSPAFTSPTLATCSSSSTSNSSGITLLTGNKDELKECPSDGVTPKNCIMMEVTLHKGQLISPWMLACCYSPL